MGRNVLEILVHSMKCADCCEKAEMEERDKVNHPKTYHLSKYFSKQFILDFFTQLKVIHVVPPTFKLKVQLELDLAHRKTDANCIHRKDNAPKPLGPIISKL